MTPVLIVDLNRQFTDYCEAEGLNAFHGNILEQRGILVSPANSYGFMDGGLDAAISDLYPQVENTVKAIIKSKYQGVLPVGQAFAVYTDEVHYSHMKHPILIVAPTMPTPATNLNGTINPYLATRAANIVYSQMGTHPTEGLNPASLPLLVPGMGTGSGGMNLKIAARQMAEGLKSVPEFPNWQAAKRYEHFLVRE